MLGLAIAAAVAALRGGDARDVAPDAVALRAVLQGPLVPQPGALPGTLAFTRPGTCELVVLDLESVTIGEPGTATSCDVWTPAHGGAAVVSRGRRGGLYELWLSDLASSPVHSRSLGPARGHPAWSPDGTRLAWCTEADTSGVLDLASGTRTAVAGCAPRIAADGHVLTRSDRGLSSSLLRDGADLLDAAALRSGFAEAGAPGAVDVLGFDVRADGLIAVAVARLGAARPEILLELWRGPQLDAAIPLPLRTVPAVGVLGELVLFSPTGDELAIGFSRTGFGLMVIDVRSRRVVREPGPARAFAWSPDGRWLAIATREAIEIAGAVRDEPAYVLPVAARAVAWSDA